MIKKIKIKSEILIASLICANYTLMPTESTFTKYYLGDFLFIKPITDNVTSFNKNLYKEIIDSLNQPCLNQISYTLLKPLILEEKKKIKGNKFRITGNLLLKKYLKKFKYNYRIYFLQQEQINWNYRVTDKELNNLAIKALFFLAGI